MHHEIDKFTHTTTTTTNTIKFHADGCYRDSEDSDSNHSTTPPPSSSGSAHGSNGPMTPAIQFYGEDRHDYHHNQNDFFDSFMGDNLFDQPERIGGQGGDAHVLENGLGGPATTSTGLGPNGSVSTSMSKTAVTEKASKLSTSGSRLHSHHFAHHHESMSAVKDHHHHYHHHLSSKSAHQRHLQSASASSSYLERSFQKHHKSSSSISGHSLSGAGCASPMSAAAMHARELHKNTFRCIEDRIESARKLVKKLHKLCPFYEVSTNGDDAGRVYCRICDRYLGAVSSTLKNHVNTQEHRQAYEDSHQPPGPNGSSSAMSFGGGSSGANNTPALPAPHALPALPAPPVPAPPTTSSAGGLTSYPNNSSRATTREDIASGSYSSGGNAPNNQKPGYPNSSSEQQQPQPQQLILQPGLPMSPFMIQASPMPYQSTIQTLDSAMQKSHLSGKYMDFDLNTVGNGHDAGNMINQGSWPNGSAANQSGSRPSGYGNIGESQNQSQQAPNGPTPQQYLFNGSTNISTSNGMTLNNLLTFTDAVVNNPSVSIIDAAASKQAMAAVLMQSNLGSHPHYAIPSSVAALGAQNAAQNGANNANNSNNMPVMAYQ